MILFYYDEVKYDPPKQESFWLGGVAIPDTSANEIETRVNEVARSTFGTSVLSRENEFHGIEICQGKGTFKGRNLAERLEVLSALAEIISSQEMFRFYIKINPVNLVATPKLPDEIAFMFLIEQVNKFLEVHKQLGMLFGDYDEPTIGTSVASLSSFRSSGTNWSRGKNIDRIIDTVHFAKSHHSRFVQLSDVYLYLNQFYSYGPVAPWRKQINDIIQKSKVLQPSFCRSWPNEPNWYK